MIFAPVEPVSARQYFKRRVLQALIVISGIFILLVTVFSWLASLMFQGFIPLLIGNALAGLIAYYAYVIWNKQPMRIQCFSCGGIVLCKTPWVCGECGHENWDVGKTTFLDDCASCHIKPKAYLCHHCDKPMFLSEDHDTTNPARRVHTEGHEPKKRAEMQRNIEGGFEEKKRNIETAKLVLTEEQIKAQIEAVKKGVGVPEIQMQTALDIQTESLKQFMDVTTAISEAARRQKLHNAETCKNDSTERRKRDLIVDNWVRQQLAKAT